MQRSRRDSDERLWYDNNFRNLPVMWLITHRIGSESWPWRITLSSDMSAWTKEMCNVPMQFFVNFILKHSLLTLTYEVMCTFGDDAIFRINIIVNSEARTTDNLGLRTSNADLWLWLWKEVSVILVSVVSRRQSFQALTYRWKWGCYLSANWTIASAGLGGMLDVIVQRVGRLHYIY